jgi:RNA polymerase sigma-70 factor (ECF subfamily)
MCAAAIHQIKGDASVNEFEELFREHYQLVYRTAYTVTGNRQDAEDVLQTVFVRLLHRDVPPDLKTSPRKYLYKAAVNGALDVIRRRKRQRLTSAVESLDVPATDTVEAQDEAIRRRLVDAVAQLSPPVIEILVLRYEHNYSDADIAKMLGKSRGVIAVTLYRARARLKRLINKSGKRQ